MTISSEAVPETSTEERITLLKEYLQDHPGTRMMDLEKYDDAVRGPLYILAKRLKQRGELLEHPKTKALQFPGEVVRPENAAAPAAEAITVHILEDLPLFKGLDNVDYSLKKGETIDMPSNYAQALIKAKKAEEVVATAPEPVEASPEPQARPETNPAIKEALSINRLLKTAREKGDAAALAEKRAEEAPRVWAYLVEKEEQQRSDDELLRSGGWSGVVDQAIDEFLAGEPMLRKAIIYSALSAGLGDHLHLMAIGDSQVGKSYALRSIGSKLFPEIFIDVASMSGKAMFYAAKEANDPRYFAGKIFLVDELADQSDGTLDFMKAGMSPGAKKLTNMTVDEHKRSSVQDIEGLPVFWSTSAEVLEDAEGQIMNRPFVVNPDETIDQTRKIMAYQRDAASVNLIKVIESKIPRARRLLGRILEEKDLAVYNLFSHHVKIVEDDARARNTLLMYFNLVAAVAYAHRFARPVVELPGRKLLFASYEDNIEAAELWVWASGPKSTGLMNRHIELLKILPTYNGDIIGGLELDEVLERYNERSGRKPIVHKTLKNMLSELSAKDKATYYEDGQGRHRWYSTASSHAVPSASHLLVGIESPEGNKLLDERLEELKQAASHLPTETQLRLAGLREELLGKRSAGQGASC